LDVPCDDLAYGQDVSEPACQVAEQGGLNGLHQALQPVCQQKHCRKDGQDVFQGVLQIPVCHGLDSCSLYLTASTGRKALSGQAWSGQTV